MITYRTLDYLFSNELIIHHVKTKEITMVKGFEHPILISIDFDDYLLLRLLFIFCFAWEDI